MSDTLNDSFIMHIPDGSVWDFLTIEEKGIMVEAVMDYLRNDTEPNFDDRALRMAWGQIKSQMGYDRSKYQKRVERNKENAQKRWAEKNAKNANASDGMQSHPNASDGMQSHPNDAYIDINTDIDIDIKSLSNINANDASHTGERESPLLESNLVRVTFEKFRRSRETMNRPLTEDSEPLMWEKLRKYSGNDPELAVKILNQAIEGGYYTLVPFKEGLTQKTGSEDRSREEMIENVRRRRAAAKEGKG